MTHRHKGIGVSVILSVFKAQTVGYDTVTALIGDINSSLCIDRKGFFSRLKISWAGSTEPHPELARLHQVIWDYCGLNPILGCYMKRPFRPHITLARNAKPTDNSISEPFTWHVTRLALMESIINPERGKSAIYKVLHEKRA